MIIWGIISSIFWAIVVAALLWVSCAFAGKLVNSGYSMSVPQHLACFVIAVPTVILLFVFFMCNKVNRMVERVDTSVAKYLLADSKFVEQLQRQINQASQTADADGLTNYLADNFSDRIISEYPMLKKYVDVSQILEKTNLSEQISNLSQGVDAAGNLQQIVQATAGGFTKGIKTKVKSVRRKLLIAVILLQVIPFGVAFYNASNYRSAATGKSSFYNSKDYY